MAAKESAFAGQEWRDFAPKLPSMPFPDALGAIVAFVRKHQPAIDFADVDRQLRADDVRFFLFPSELAPGSGIAKLPFDRDPPTKKWRLWCSTQPVLATPVSLGWLEHRERSWKINESEVLKGSLDWERGQEFLHDTGVAIADDAESPTLPGLVRTFAATVVNSANKTIQLLDDVHFDGLLEVLNTDVELSNVARASGVRFVSSDKERLVIFHKGWKMMRLSGNCAASHDDRSRPSTPTNEFENK